MMSRSRSRWILAGVTVLVLIVGACAQFALITWPWFGSGDGTQVTNDGGADTDLTEAPISVEIVADSAATTPSSASSSRQTAVVRRGPVSELLSLTGRVAGLDEVAVTFPSLARVEKVAVSAGQMVDEGQVLLEADRKEAEKDLEAARTRLEVSSVRLSQAEAQAQARQRETERRIEAERVRQQFAVGDAEAGFRRAQADLERVRMGAPVSERQAAEGAVISARAALSRAEVELARVTARPGEVELKVADQQVWSARLALQRAETELERLRRGPDPTEFRAAEREVANAEAAVLRATADLERLVRGPDPLAASTAGRDVQRAELALRVAQSAKDGKDKNARLAREAAIRSAELNLQDARERVARLNVGQPAGEVEAARRGVTVARSALDAAKERYRIVASGPDELTLASANQAVEQARAAAANAEVRYLELEAGAPPDRVQAAQQAVQSARVGLASALSRQAEVNGHPTRAELREAEDRLAAAQTAIDRVQAAAEEAPLPSDDEADPASFDLILLERGLEQDRGLVKALEREVAAARLLAPFSGVVAAVHVQSGDPMEPGRAVVTIARPGAPIVRADPSERELARLASGMRAQVQIEGLANQQFDASVLAVEAGTGVVPNVSLSVDWGPGSTSLGANAQAVVTLQRKDDALLVPQRAIRTLGPRRFVEVMDGTSRRNVDVQVGIVQGSDAEILSGLTQGQVVAVGP
jgi:HlyD family secretion protein